MNIRNKQQIHFICGFWEKEMKFKPIIKIMVLAAFEKEKKTWTYHELFFEIRSRNMSYIQNRKHFELYFPFNKKTREKRNQFKTQKIRMDGMFFTSFL
jgi:hypothetical protein